MSIFYTFTFNDDQEPLILTEDGGTIPFDEANTDYQAYLAWVEEGNTPEEWTPETSDEASVEEPE